jgi:glycosyltransferase involved in cell wall biosynthesis
MVRLPKISVIMSVFNGEKYLREAVDSILNQTFVDFEFILINDGSTDKTKAILDSCHDARIRLIHQENIGLTESLNKGLGMARGVYIARMDADDISHVNRLEKEAAFLDANKDVGLVGTFGIRIDEKGKAGHLISFPTSDEALRKRLEYDCPFLHGAVMYRKECIDRVGNYRKKIGPSEDLDLWLRISERFGLACLDEPLYKDRVVSDGVSMSLRFNQVRAILLTRKLSNDRKTAGKDELDTMSDSDVEHVLDSLMPPTEVNKRNVLYAKYNYLADVSYFAGDYFQAFKWLSRSLLVRPFSWQSIVLALKTVVASVLPKALVRKTKEKYHVPPQRRNKGS